MQSKLKLMISSKILIGKKFIKCIFLFLVYFRKIDPPFKPNQEKKINTIGRFSLKQIGDYNQNQKPLNIPNWSFFETSN